MHHFDIEGIHVERIAHSGFFIRADKTIYIDLFKTLQRDFEPADLVLVTHEHFDHLSVEDLRKIVTPETTIVSTPICEQELSSLAPKQLVLLKPNEFFDFGDIRIETVPAYNTNKFKSPGVPFHRQGDGRLGFVLDIYGTRIYHMGDTDNIPELANVHNIDVALMPVSGTYVMTPDEAAEAVGVFKPDKAVPMHYGTIIGSEKDAKAFREKAACDVRIL